MTEALRGLVLGGLLLFVGWAAMRLTRRLAWKQAIGAWTVLAALVCFVGCWLPVWLPVLPQPDFRTTLEAKREQAQKPNEVIPLMFELQPEMPVVRLASEDWSPNGQLPANPISEIEVELPAAPVVAQPTWTWIEALPWLVLLVPAGLFSYLAIGQLALVRLVCTSRPVLGRAHHVYRTLTSHLLNPPRVLTNDRLTAPVCFGWLRHTIVLPTQLAEKATTAQLNWIYRHELDHLNRGDHDTAAVLGIAQVVFFAVPWFWLLKKELLRTQEHLADAAAVGSNTKEATDYAEFLVDLSERTQTQRPLAALSVQATPSELFRRVNMLLSTPKQRPASRTLSRWLGAGVLATAVTLSGLGFASAQVPVAPPPLPPAPGEGAPAVVPVAPGAPVAPFAPLAPLAPPPSVEEKKIKELQTKLEKLVLDGKTDDAKKVVDEITKLKEKIAERPVAPVGPPLANPMILPPAAPRPPMFRGDFVAPVMEAQVSKLRKQYDEQLKTFDDLIEKAKDADAKEGIKKAKEEYKKQMAETIKEEEAKAKQDLFRPQEFQLQLAVPMAVPFDGQPFGFAQDFVPRQSTPRFGVQTIKIPEALIEQLDLAKDTGLLVQEVIAGSVAEKGGVKKNDVLMKFAGQAVPTDSVAFGALVTKQKAGEKFDVVVLRKGKETKIEGLTLTEVKKPQANGKDWQSMSIQISNDDVTVSATADGVTYKLSGPLTDGVFAPESITVGEKKYDSVDKVPEAEQARVKALIGRVGRSK
jgi:beta-lactamase regulating signal transducer with metallopeptidase domain